MRTFKLVASSFLLTAVLLSCNSNGNPNETQSKNEAINSTDQENDKFSGTYKIKSSDGKIMEQGVRITFDNGTYHFRAEGSEAVPGIVSEDGKTLLFKSEESSKINEDGVVTANLAADVKVYFENGKLVWEMVIPELGSEKMELMKQ